MSDVQETLQELMTRRLREMGRSRGLDGPLPLRQAHERLPVGNNGRPTVSYETFRQILTGVHSGKITQATADAVSFVLEVDVDDVLLASGQRPRLGAFDLPPEAQQLTRKERRIVLGVINAILAAGSEEDEAATEGEVIDFPQRDHDPDLDADALPVDDTPQPTASKTVGKAARKVTKPPKK